jgi:O-antigen ligase
MIFGNGLGASYFDNNNTFDFVGKHDFAFSEEELESRRFYNFHDIWSDVGFRIGLAPLALLFIWLIRKYWKLSSRDDESFIPLFCIVLLFCAFFSTAGIIFIFIILNNIYEKINYK